MKQTLPWMMLALALSGCNAKLARHVQSMDDLSVKVRHQQVRPEVDLSDLESGTSDEAADLKQAGAGVAVDRALRTQHGDLTQPGAPARRADPTPGIAAGGLSHCGDG